MSLPFFHLEQTLLLLSFGEIFLLHEDVNFFLESDDFDLKFCPGSRSDIVACYFCRLFRALDSNSREALFDLESSFEPQLGLIEFLLALSGGREVPVLDSPLDEIFHPTDFGSEFFYCWVVRTLGDQSIHLLLITSALFELSLFDAFIE